MACILILILICLVSSSGASRHHLKKDPLKTIWSEDGDIIDCVDILKQPAFDNPKLKTHKIQMPPRDTTTTANTTEPLQTWMKSGSCPNGTVPIRRITEKQMFKASLGLGKYGRKKPNFSYKLVGQLNENIELGNHSKVILLAERNKFFGAKGDFEVCSPFVQNDDEYSTSRVALVNKGDNDYESVEASWAVNPSVYGDHQTRLFAYWTVDEFGTTGCFDMTCPGFIQTSSEITLGAALNPNLISGGVPIIISIHIYKDSNTNDWWLSYGEKTIGYWPTKLFKAICDNADSVEWGGEIYSTSVGNTPHTKTEMGNGRFPTDSASIMGMRIQDDTQNLKIPEFVNYYTDEYHCYRFWFTVHIEDPKFKFYYGGPGRNPACP